jgi:hypothetical protein
MAGCTTISLPQVVASGTTPGTSASPGFQAGRAGNVVGPTYLQVVATVPSNTAGLIVPFTGFITGIWTTNELLSTYEIQIQERTGAAFNNIVGATVSTAASRKGQATVLAAVVAGWELVFLVNAGGSGRNIQAGIIIEQSA